MRILSEKEVKDILKYGNEIGEGSTRKILKYKDRFFKVAFNNRESENRNEINLYLGLKEEYKFLNKIYAYSKDYKVIEIEYLDCEEIDDLVSELESDNLGAPIYIEELIDLIPWIRETIDFDFNLVTEFIEMNSLDPMEILLPFQWGINKEGKLRISDYSR